MLPKALVIMGWRVGFTSPGQEVMKLSSCSTQLSMKFIMLMNVKMPTIVGILTFISIINTTSESLKESKVFIFQHFSFMSNLNFMLSWGEHDLFQILGPVYSRCHFLVHFSVVYSLPGLTAVYINITMVYSRCHFLVHFSVVYSLPSLRAVYMT